MTRRDDFYPALRYAAPPPMWPVEDELDPLGIVRLIRRRLWQILAIAAAIVAISFPFILGLKPSYSANSKLLLQNPMTTALASSTEERMVELNLTTEVERMLSRDVATEVIRTLDIASNPEFNASLRPQSLIDEVSEYIRQLVGSKQPLTPASEIDRVIPAFQSRLTVARDPQSDVILIGFSSEDPQLAAAVPNTLLRVYLADREASLSRDVLRADAWLGVRIKEQQARVDAANAAVVAFAKSSGLADGDPVARAAQDIATQSAIRTDVERQRFELRTTLADIEAASDSTDKVALIASPSLDALDKELRQRRIDLESLSRTYGESYPSVAAARSATLATEHELNAEIERIAQSMRSKLSALDRQDKDISSQITVATERMSRLNAAVAELDELRRVAAQEKAGLEQLQEKTRVLAAEGKLPVADVEVLSPATPPVAPTTKGRLFYLLAISVAAVAIGLTAATALEFIDRSVRSFQQLRAVPGVKGIAMVPAVSRKTIGSVEGLVARGHVGRFGQAMRGLVLELRQEIAGRLPASLLVTSPLPAEGKSSISAALAVEIAAGGQRVLLVDGDLSHGRLHRLFATADSPGLADYLRGEATFEEIIRHDAANGIDFVARGTQTKGRHRDGNALSAFIEAATGSDRMVIFDSAPVFASVETTRIDLVVERTLLVTRWGRTRREAIESAVARLGPRNNAEIFVAINMVDTRRHRLYGFKEAEGYSSALRRYEHSHG